MKKEIVLRNNTINDEILKRYPNYLYCYLNKDNKTVIFLKEEEIMLRKIIIPQNKIICGNNVEVLKTFPDNFIDLTITSPPYDNLRKNKEYKADFDFKGLAQELYRVMKVGGVIIWVVGDATIKGSETLTSFKQALYFKEIGFLCHDTMLYQRMPKLPDSVRYNQNFEYMFIFSKKTKPKTINFIYDRKNKLGGQKGRWGKHTIRQKDGSMLLHAKSEKGKIILVYGKRTNVWNLGNAAQLNDDKIAFQHPAIFPEKLVRDHIYSWSNEGDIVLDCFSGSGTSLKMAHIMNRKYIGIDISEEYCKLSQKRVDSVKDRKREYDKILSELNPTEEIIQRKIDSFL